MNHLEILKHYWGYDSFRGIQEEIIQSISRGEDTLGLMPTGGGKSITFQVPALAMEGLCLVITPLIALMKDQVLNLQKRGLRALCIHAGMEREEVLRTLDNCIFGHYKFLYVSPERLGTELFQRKLRKMHISFITVDESHCISQWGYDFRPAYLRIAEIRELLPGVPVLALTATATPEVVKDIQLRLGFRRENVFRMSFERKNLAYIVRRALNKESELLHILERIPGSAIVYVRNRRLCQELAKLLQANGLSADFYHAGLDDVTRDLRQRLWSNGETRVMVATNAFGMGIDKPDVRLVIHYDLPDSIEAYFQEAGRAGRDGQPATAVMLYYPSDRTTVLKRLSVSFPEKEYIRDVYEKLQYYFQMAMGDGLGCVREFDIEDFCIKFKLFPVNVDGALRLLTLAGYLEYTEERDNASRLRFILLRDELYRLREMDAVSDKVVQAVLRLYTGLFSDYVFIRESAIATYCGLTPEQVYEVLIRLSKLRIISYIPHRRTPYIIYTRERVERERIQIPPAAYEERKQRMEKRIEALLEYASQQQLCRSRYLLRYFGEEQERKCGCCDVCLGEQQALGEANQEQEVARYILQRLSQHPCRAVELGAGTTHWSPDLLNEVLEKLINQQRVCLKEGLLRVKN
ncbi:MAG: ATP-dependent DNA helicase RecQ [Bacteroides sp.]